jgi:hypothetical protein
MVNVETVTVAAIVEILIAPTLAETLAGVWMIVVETVAAVVAAV